MNKDTAYVYRSPYMNSTETSYLDREKPPETNAYQWNVSTEQQYDKERKLLQYLPKRSEPSQTGLSPRLSNCLHRFLDKRVEPNPASLAWEWEDNSSLSSGTSTSSGTPTVVIDPLEINTATDIHKVPDKVSELIVEAAKKSLYSNNNHSVEYLKQVVELKCCLLEKMLRSTSSQSPILQHNEIVKQHPWAHKLLHAVQNYMTASDPTTNPPLAFYDFEHILQPSDDGGFHFCPDINSSPVQLVNIKTNPKTTVFCAEFDNQGSSKFSTFFPSEIKTAEQLFECLNSAREISRMDNRALCEVYFQQKKFHVVRYMREQGLIVKSVFPVFVYEQFGSNLTYQITNNYSLSSTEIFQRAKAVISQVMRDKIFFIWDDKDTANERIIVDVASNNITEEPKCGIYIDFSITDFDEDTKKHILVM